jgi:ABC-type nitrate/sulfonate/bicarbonate transport system ATPase subunit
MQEELRRLWQVTRATVVFVTHSVDEAAYLGTRVLATRDRIMAVVREAQRGSTEG